MSHFFKSKDRGTAAEFFPTPDHEFEVRSGDSVRCIFSSVLRFLDPRPCQDIDSDVISRSSAGRKTRVLRCDNEGCYTHSGLN